MTNIKRQCAIRLFLVVLLVGWLLPRAVRAQQVIDFEDRLAKDRPEFWAMKRVGSEALLTSLGVPGRTRVGTLDFGFEFGWLPALDDQQRLIGFNGTKAENVNRTPLFVRPRITVGLPHDVSLTVGYVPPVRLGGIQPNLLAVAAGRPLFTLALWQVGLRLYGQLGTLQGDITCDRDTVAAGPDPVRNPYLCEAPSNDRMTIRSAGLELSNGFAVSERFEPYVAAAWNYFDTEFHTNARYSGLLDISRSVGSGPSFSMTAGIAYRLAPKIQLAGEVFYSPMDVRRFMQPRIGDGLFNVRALLNYRLR